MSDDRSHSLTIEDLLRLKRAECPPQEFWSQFERELREKQLAAIVEKRPWWCAIPGLYVFVVRRRLSLAAVASAFAVSLAGFHAYRASVAAPDNAFSEFQLAALSASAPALRPMAVAAGRSSANEVRQAAMDVAVADGSGRSAAPVARNATAYAQTLPAIPFIDAIPQGTATERFEAISRSLTGDLSPASASIPEGTRGLFSGVRDFGARPIAARTSVAEPLAQMPSPSEERRSRLLAEAFPAMAGPADVVPAASERVLGRLSDDRLYSSGGRYDVATDRALNSIKFSIRF